MAHTVWAISYGDEKLLGNRIDVNRNITSYCKMQPLTGKQTIMLLFMFKVSLNQEKPQRLASTAGK